MVQLNKSRDLRKDVGERFKAVRQLVDKSRKEIASDLEEPVSRIKSIEKGEAFPGFVFFDYLYHQYGVNVNWLVSGNEDVFLRKRSKAWKQSYKKHNDRLLFDESQAQSEINSLILLIQIPAIRNHILTKLGEAKSLFRGVIEEYEKN